MAAALLLPVTGDDDADRLLQDDPLALVLGMLLDQQVPMEWAFKAPSTLKTRLGDRFDATAIAAMDPEDVVAVFCEKPALHRFPAAMGRRVHDLCTIVRDEYDGDAANLWRDVADGSELLRRVNALPGYGKEKSKIFVALLAKRFAVAPSGWEAAATPFSDTVPRSVADISSREAFKEVRAWKQEQKRQGKSKQD